MNLRIFIFSIFVLNQSCTQVKDTYKFRNFDLKVGDLLFQDSDCGPFCDAIEKVTFGIDGCKFSHVGIFTRDGLEGRPLVLEAIGRGVVATPIDSFFMRSYDGEGKSKVVVGRMKTEFQSLIPAAIEHAISLKGKPYDDGFDIENDKYYCSELIYNSFRAANNGKPIFTLFPMTYKDPATNATFPIWTDYFKDLKMEIPEGKPGLNPGGMSRENCLKIVNYYGKPSVQ